MPARVAPAVDRDYLVMVMQLRRYLYGNLTESKLRALATQRARRITYPGVMSYFPLADDMAQLKQLDGWMLHTVATSLRQRGRLLSAAGVASLPSPHGIDPQSLLSAKGYSGAGVPLDLSLPSFVRIARLIRRAARAHGPNAVGKGTGPHSYKY